MLERITPLILTYNEAPNIGRTLACLSWAQDIVIVDSYSTDATLSIAARWPQVRIYQRTFDTLEKQWNYAITETDIKSEWVLALDADYQIPRALIEEIQSLKPTDEIKGYRAKFRYCIYGRALRGSAYPPVTVLYRRAHAKYRQDGHAHRVVIEGAIPDLKEHALHDDWKPLSRWLSSQNEYQQQELEKLLRSDAQGLSWPDRLRRMRFVAPFVVFFYCLFVQRGILDGRAGIYYAFQRMLAETLLSLYLLDRELVLNKSEQFETGFSPAPIKSKSA